MPRDAIVILDLQADFLESFGKRPLPAAIAQRLLDVAHAAFAGELVPDALPVLAQSAYSADARLGNFLRKRVTIEGTRGADLDSRLEVPDGVRIFTKSRSSAFSDPAFEPYLRENGVTRLIVVGVPAEGSVRATARDAARRGFEVRVPLDAVATDSHLRMAYARLAMLQAGVRIVRTLPTLLPDRSAAGA